MGLQYFLLEKSQIDKNMLFESFEEAPLKISKDLKNIPLSPEGKEFLEKLLATNPEDRMTAFEAFNHPGWQVIP